MQLTKSQSISLALGFLALFFVAGVTILSRSRASVDAPRENVLLGSGVAAIPTPMPLATPEAGAKFELKQFHRTETRNGVKVWEVTGTSGQYFPETNSAKVLQAELFVFKPNGDHVKLDAGVALLHLQGPDLTKAEATGGVTMLVNDKYHIVTDNAVYDKTQGTVFAPGEVTMTSDTMDLQGTELHADLEKQIMTLSHEVSTVIKPKPSTNTTTKK